MCGISGYISDEKLIRKNSEINTINLMRLRGPNSDNYITKFVQNKKIALLHSRLNIIDLKERSNQPFIIDNFTLIFNGEIYNYLEIRNKLKHKYKFKTQSDTEVLLRAFQEYGEKCVDHFVGMWAFAIWDDKKKELFLSRDPFGEKPLYYYLSEKGFFFGSEIKFIKSLCKKNFTINKGLINDHLFLGYKSLNKKNLTYYNKIYSLESSTNIKINLKLKITKKKYWNPKLEVDKKISKYDAIEGIKCHLINSVKYRLRADVPLAFCLSGGIDSSLLASIARKKLNQEISTFSIIDSDPRYNEEENINIINKELKSNSNLIKLKKKKNFFDRMKNLVHQHDGPLATLSYYIHSFLTEQISKQGYKVSISGTGADEIFTGYYDHHLLFFQTIRKSKDFAKNLDMWRKYVLPNIRNENLKNPYSYINNKYDRSIVYEKNYNLFDYSLTKSKSNFEEKYFCQELMRNRMLNELFYEVVPVILKHDDLNSMYYSIENRSPYLDRDLIEFSLKLSPNYFIENGFQKYLLRCASKRILNDKIRLNRQKKGFNASISSLVDMKNQDNLEYIFDIKSPIAEIINLKQLKKDINKLKVIPNHFSKLIFSLIGSKIFLENPNL